MKLEDYSLNKIKITLLKKFPNYTNKLIFLTDRKQLTIEDINSYSDLKKALIQLVSVDSTSQVYSECQACGFSYRSMKFFECGYSIYCKECLPRKCEEIFIKEYML